MVLRLFDLKTRRQRHKTLRCSVDDGSQTVIGGGGHIGHYDIEGKIKDEADLIRRYREVAIQPECDQAIEDIVNRNLLSQTK